MDQSLIRKNEILVVVRNRHQLFFIRSRRSAYTSARATTELRKRSCKSLRLRSSLQVILDAIPTIHADIYSKRRHGPHPFILRQTTHTTTRESLIMVERATRGIIFV